LKFKYLIIAFGIIIAAAALILIFLPMLLPDSGQDFHVTLAVNFRFIAFPLLAFMAVLLIGLSAYFIINYRLLSLLEREDWPALAYYLEHLIYVKGRYTYRNVRLLASSYLVISDYKSVLKLETKTQLAKPLLIGKIALIFGAARILEGNRQESVSFYKGHLNSCRKADKEWVSWFSGFTQLLAGSYQAAEAEFSSISVSSKDAIITGLSAYFLGSTLEKRSLTPDKCRNISETGKERVLKALKNAAGWKKETGKAGNDIHIAIIKKYIDEAGEWIFK